MSYAIARVADESVFVYILNIQIEVQAYHASKQYEFVELKFHKNT